MTTVRMQGIWVQWNDSHTAVVDFGAVTMDWIGSRTLSYSYSEGWTGAAPPTVEVFPPPTQVRVELGDGSVRTLTDGLSNTVFFGETTDGSEIGGAFLGLADPVQGVDYLFGLDSILPFIEGENVRTVDTVYRNLIANTQQIATGPFSPADPIALDGTSNTIFVSERDVLVGDAGDQTYHGGIGRDLLGGKGGRDALYGEDGNDRLGGDAGGDSLSGGRGDDRLFGGSEADLLFGGLGNDTANGGSGNDRLFGGDAVVSDAAGNDDLFGDAGNDTLYGGAGLDILDGGAGDDILHLGAGADAIVFSQGSGQDLIADFSLTDGDLLQLNQNLTGGLLTGAEVIDSFATITTLGRFVLDFGNGDVIDIRAAPGTDLALLAGQIDVF